MDTSSQLKNAQQGEFETTDAYKARLVNLFTTAKISLQDVFEQQQAALQNKFEAAKAANKAHYTELLQSEKQEYALAMNEEQDKFRALEKARSKAEMNKELQLHKEKLDDEVVQFKRRVQIKATADIAAGLQGAQADAHATYREHVATLEKKLECAHVEVHALQQHINSQQSVHKEKLIAHNLPWLRKEEKFRRQQAGVMRDLWREMDRTCSEITSKRRETEIEFAHHMKQQQLQQQQLQQQQQQPQLYKRIKREIV